MKTGPAEPRSTVLTEAEEAMVVAFRRHTLLISALWARIVAGTRAKAAGTIVDRRLTSSVGFDGLFELSCCRFLTTGVWVALMG